VVKVILQSEKFSTLFLIQHVTTTGRETFRESTHYFSFLDGLEWKTRKEARFGELKIIGKAMNQYQPRSQK